MAPFYGISSSVPILYLTSNYIRIKMLHNYYKERESYINDGTIMLNQHNNIFTQTELQNLEKLADQLPFEHVEIGDADEPNYLEVGRLITDIDKPKIVNQTISKQVIGIVSSKEKMNSTNFC